MNSTAVAVQGGGGALALNNMMLEDAGDGSSFSASEIAIPFFALLQGGSPQVKEGKGTYIEGAKEGMVINTLNNDLYDIRAFTGKEQPGIDAIFAAKTPPLMVEWVPRSQGGGWAGEHVPGSDVHKTAREVKEMVDGKERKALRLPNGNNLVETIYYYAILLTDVPFWAKIGMASSQLGPARKANSMINDTRFAAADGTAFKPPIYGIKVNLKTTFQEKKNYSWWLWNVERVGRVDDTEQYQTARKFAEAVKSGAIRATVPVVDDAAESTSDANEDF